MELGCGNGITTNFIVKKFPKARIVALDYDADQIEIAQKKKLNNVEFIVGDASDLKFKDGTFDMVIESLAFQLIEDTASGSLEVALTTIDILKALVSFSKSIYEIEPINASIVLQELDNLALAVRESTLAAGDIADIFSKLPVPQVGVLHVPPALGLFILLNSHQQ